MPISATGNNRPHTNGFMPLRRSAEHGFTLIELMVVLVILALASAAVVLAIPSGAAGLRHEATAFAARTITARNAAIIGGRPMRILADASGYRIEERRDGRWLPWGGKAGRPAAWDRGTVVATTGAIVFDSTGLIEPASLRLQNGARVLAVQVDADGSVHVQG